MILVWVDKRQQKLLTVKSFMSVDVNIDQDNIKEIIKDWFEVSSNNQNKMMLTSNKCIHEYKLGDRVRLR